MKCGRSYLNSNLGFSMVELLIAMLIVGFVGLTLSQMTSFMTKSSRSGSLGTDFNTMVAGAAAIANYPPSCLTGIAGQVHLVGGLTPAALSDTQVYELTHIGPPASPVIKVAQTVADKQIGGITVTSIALNKMIHPLGTNSNGHQGYLINIKITAQKQKTGDNQTLVGKNDLVANIPVPLFFDNGNRAMSCE